MAHGRLAQVEPFGGSSRATGLGNRLNQSQIPCIERAVTHYMKRLHQLDEINSLPSYAARR
jgi:hypothetical protein